LAETKAYAVAPTADSSRVRQKVSDYLQLVKFRLSLTVVFSASMAYAIALSGQADWLSVLLLSVGGFLVTAAANAVNEVLEHRFDRLMKRTKDRPVAARRMAKLEALVAASTMLSAGIALLTIVFNWQSALLALLSFVLYAFVYTPLKRVTPLSVVVGAVPGALPPVIGVVAATGHFFPWAAVLFAFQFLWQFPHFYSIAFLGARDYNRAGYRMLPYRNPQHPLLPVFMVLYTIGLVAMAIVTVAYGLVPAWAGYVVGGIGVLFLVPVLAFWVNRTRKTALWVMLVSLLYIPAVWTLLLLA